MALALYNFAIFCFKLALKLVSPFNPKAKQMVQGRNLWKSKLAQDFHNLDHPVMWIHCASLGEFEQGRPLLESFGSAFPNYKILVTFFSPSGYQVRKDYPEAYAVHYLPFDTLNNAKDFFDIVKPKIIFIVKYEFWYHIISEAKNRQVPVIVFSSIFNAGQIFFKPFGGFFRMILSNLDHLFVQDYNSLNLLKNVGINSVSVAGDTRMDRVVSITENAPKNELVERFLGNQKGFIIGSSWPQDISVLAPLINSEGDIKFIIAPHEINTIHLNQIDKLIERPTVRYSNYDDTIQAEVLVIDSIGILSHLYQYGKYAYIGGAFGKGLHNILEAATFGLPLFFGNKNYKKFLEAKSLVENKGAFSIGSSKDLISTYNKVNRDNFLYKNTSKVCLNFVKDNTGATKIILDYVRSILKS